MLTAEENELLCRVGPGTLMGDLIRQYWIPFGYPWELPPDGPPIRIRLLGEDLLAFRGTSGQVGLIGDKCVHRGGGLFFGRNEEDGLRCVYHGWKYSASGACVDMPNEPAQSDFKSRIFIKSYKCTEVGGVIWVYMGPRQDNPPGVPQLEWTQLPETHIHHAYKYVLQNNWAQALEGDVDSSHTAFLHNRNWNDTTSPGRRDRAPVYESLDTPWGVMGSAKRHSGPGEIYHRIYQVVMPFHTFFAGPAHMWVPIDDDHTLVMHVAWDPRAEIPHREMNPGDAASTVGMGEMRPELKGKFFANWWPAADEDNDFLIDRELQRTRTFTGIPTTRTDDAAMTISMGSIVDRAVEHLGAGDLMIIKVRKRLLDAARALREQGTVPPLIEQPELARVRGGNAILPEGADWQAEMADWLYCRTNDVLPGEAAYVAAGGGRPGQARARE